MTKPILPALFTLAALVAVASDAHAQRGAALCQGLAEAQQADETQPDPAVDGVPCTNLEGRIYAQSPSHGVEEDAIIGVGSADVTLINAQIDGLATTRIELVPAAGANTYLFIDWVVAEKADADGGEVDADNLVSLAVAFAGQDGGTLSDLPAVQFHNPRFINSLFGGGTKLVRVRSGSFGIPTVGVANTPVVAGVYGTEADWSALTGTLDDTVTIRLIVRYRVVTTADTF